MNRQQRRHMQKQSFTGRQPGQRKPTKINYGHNGTNCVVIQFDYPVDNIFLTDEQADDMIKSIGEARRLLAAHTADAGKAANG